MWVWGIVCNINLSFHDDFGTRNPVQAANIGTRRPKDSGPIVHLKAKFADDCPRIKVHFSPPLHVRQ